MSVNLLVADDDEAVRRLFARYLGSLGHVDEAATGEEAAALLESCRYDFVVLDLRMHGHDGLEVLRGLASGPNAETPVCVISGDVSDESRRIALAAGAAHFLTKPLRLGELRELARDALERAGLRPPNPRDISLRSIGRADTLPAISRRRGAPRR